MIKLVTKVDASVDSVREKLSSLLDLTTEARYHSLACVMIRDDGQVFVTTVGNGTRTLLLGAVHDLAYTIARDGDL